MSSLEHAYSTRELILARLEEDLLGGTFDAELTEAPLSRFIAGVLYPDIDDTAQQLPDSVDQHSEEGYEKEDGPSAPHDTVDPGVSLSHVRQPRSMGLTFAIDATHAATVRVTVTARRYEELTDQLWHRVEPPACDIDLDCSAPDYGRRPVFEGLDLRWVVRDARDGAVSVTLSLVNTALAPRGHRDDRCWFNPSILVEAAAGGLRERPAQVIAGTDESDVLTQRLLFRDVKSYGVGHGCAVTWTTDGDGSVTSLSTTFMPRHELLLSDPSGLHVGLSMSAMARSERSWPGSVLSPARQRWYPPGRLTVGRSRFTCHGGRLVLVVMLAFHVEGVRGRWGVWGGSG